MMKRVCQLLAFTLGVCGVLTTVTPAAVAEATHAKLPGTVLTSAPAPLPAELEPLATGRRVSYVTTDPAGLRLTATGLVLTPKTGRTYRTVAWGHGTTGLAD